MANPLSAAKVILLAAADLAADGSGEFSEWDLTVASWRRDQNRFGCRGYEDEYPDHKRVMMEIMGKKKKDNPIRQGWVERVRPNFYRMTALGLAEAERLGKGSMRAGPTPRSSGNVYLAVERYISHPTFRRYITNPDEPRTWLGAQALLGLTKNDSVALRDAFKSIENAAEQALTWMEEEGVDSINSGPTGGGKAIGLLEVRRLKMLVQAIRDRFSPEIEAIELRS